jgi:holin-like protein
LIWSSKVWMLHRARHHQLFLYLYIRRLAFSALPVHPHIMIRGLAILLVFQSLGEVATKFIHGLIPGPVIGMILLLAFLVWQKKIAPSISIAADGLLAHLAIFFIPAAVGVMLYVRELSSAGVAWFLAIILSTAVSMTIAALLLKWFFRHDVDAPKQSHPSP